MVLVAFFQFLIIWLMSSINYVPIMEAILNQLPPQMKIIFNQEFMNRLSIDGAAAFGFNHPIVLTVLGIVAIFSLTVSCATILMVIIVAGWIGSFSALIIFNHFSTVMFSQLMKIGLNLWILLCLITSYSLLISVYGREAGKSGLRSAGITLIFYFFNFIATLW